MRWVVVALALLGAGCVEPAEPGRVVTTGHPELPKLYVTATLTSAGSGHRVDATAWNDGQATYYVRGLCHSPWEAEIRGSPGEPVPTARPKFRCEAVRWDPLGPREALRHTAWWNETVWNGETNATQDPPPGAYTFELRFTAHTAPEAEGRTMAAGFRIHVR